VIGTNVVAAIRSWRNIRGPLLHRQHASNHSIRSADTYTPRVRTWNPGAERFKGYAADEIIGRDFSVFYSPEDVTRGLPSELLARAKAEGHVSDEGWRVRKDGT
jgi:PAS domain S-box-containing protein